MTWPHQPTSQPTPLEAPVNSYTIPAQHCWLYFFILLLFFFFFGILVQVAVVSQTCVGVRLTGKKEELKKYLILE